MAVADIYAGMMDTVFADTEKYLIARLKRIDIDRLAYPCLLSCGSRQVYPDATIDELSQSGTIQPGLRVIAAPFVFNSEQTPSAPDESV